MTTIQVQMSAKMAEMLVTVSTRWDAPLWEQDARDGRFEPVDVDQPLAVPARYVETNAYWLESGASALVLFTSYVAAHGHEFSVLWDLADDGGFVVLTDWQPNA